MKVGKIPVAAIILLTYSAVRIVAVNFFNVNYPQTKPFLDGSLMGALFVYGLYYLNIYVTAWLRNRKEGLAK